MKRYDLGSEDPGSAQIWGGLGAVLGLSGGPLGAVVGESQGESFTQERQKRRSKTFGMQQEGS